MSGAIRQSCASCWKRILITIGLHIIQTTLKTVFTGVHPLFGWLKEYHVG